MADLELTLSWLGMTQYLDRFLEAGFDSWETILEITENDLEACATFYPQAHEQGLMCPQYLNVDRGHRRKLQKEIKNTKRLAQDPGFVQPLYGIVPEDQYPSALSPASLELSGPKKRAYRHHPKPDTKAPKRPASAYVLFSNHIRELTKEENPSFSDLSKDVGRRWQALSEEDRDVWRQKNAGDWDDFRKRSLEYTKSQGHRDHQKYVENFKAVQQAKDPKRRESTSLGSPVTAKAPSYQFPGASASPLEQPQHDRGLKIEEGCVGSKVPIKRLQREEDDWSGGAKARQKRSKQACGEKSNVTESNLYVDIAEKMEYSALTKQTPANQERGNDVDKILEKLKAYEALLLQFVSTAEASDQHAIQDALLMPPQLEGSIDAMQRIPRFSGSDDDSSSRSHHGESEASGVGSMGPTDQIDEDDFAQEGQEGDTAAFTGQASETKWLQRLRSELNPSQNKRRSMGQRRGSTHIGQSDAFPGRMNTQSRSNMEDMDTSVVGDQLYPYELPLRSTADALLNGYFSSVHLSFPILSQPDFQRRYADLYDTMDPASYSDRIFIATLMLVFAIGAVHAHLIEADWVGDQRDHMLYFANARSLAVDSGILNDACSLGQVQVFALAAMYTLITDQINRAWNSSGLAIRSAQSMGLHLMNVTPSMPAEERDFHAQIWFAIASLESMLVFMTSRPSMVNAQDCSVSLNQVDTTPTEVSSAMSESSQSQPSSAQDFATAFSSARTPSSSMSGPPPFRSRQPSDLSTNPPIATGTTAQIYFKHYTLLCNLAKEIIHNLYNPSIRTKKWVDIQAIMSTYSQRLYRWRSSLPPPFDDGSFSQDQCIESCRVALRILFHSTHTIIHRPSLCRLDQRIADQSQSSKCTNRMSANKCVESAQSVISLILDKPTSTVLNHGAMWWMLLHHMKRALIVLLLELAFRADHMPEEAEEILTAAKAAMEWLRHIAVSSPTARDTWTSLSSLLKQAAQRVGRDTSDIITPPQDPGFDIHPNPPQPPPQQQGHQQQQQFPQRQLSFQPTTFPQTMYPPPQQPARQPSQYTYDPTAYPPLGFYLDFPSQNQGGRQYYGDLAVGSEWDEFGFLKAEGGMGSFFPPDQGQGMGLPQPQGGGQGQQQGGGYETGSQQQQGWYDYSGRRGW